MSLKEEMKKDLVKYGGYTEKMADELVETADKAAKAAKK